jgi:hypothetical protein
MNGEERGARRWCQILADQVAHADWFRAGDVDGCVERFPDGEDRRLRPLAGHRPKGGPAVPFLRSSTCGNRLQNSVMG